MNKLDTFIPKLNQHNAGAQKLIRLSLVNYTQKILFNKKKKRYFLPLFFTQFKKIIKTKKNVENTRKMYQHIWRQKTYILKRKFQNDRFGKLEVFQKSY